MQLVNVVQQRVDALGIHPTTDPHLANLFRQLGWLEELAVLMCTRHEAVRGQLQDELVHRHAFWTAAGDDFGSPIEPIGDLIAWTNGLEGEAQMAVLNLVAEVWLEGVLNALAEIPDHPYARLFASVAEDEKRHTEVEVDWGDIDPGPYVRTLEKHLHAITADPRFLWPLYREMGHDRMVLMARELHEAHEKACEALEIGVGRHFKELLRCREEAEGDQGVEELELDRWRQSAFNMHLGSMEGTREIEWVWEADAASIEARVVRAIHRTLAFNPQWNLTIAEGRKALYRPVESCVGVRREGKPGVVAAYTRAVEELPTMIRQIRKNGARARQAAVVIPEISDELLAIQPPPRMAAVVSSLPNLQTGLAPLVRGEGVTWNLVVGELRPDGTLTIRCHVDHRAVDGSDLAEFLQHLEWNLGVRRSL